MRSTVGRRLSTLASFYRYCEQEQLIDRNPALNVRRPKVDYESRTLGLDRNELGAFLVRAGLGSARDHALASLLAFNGLRVSEALGADIGDLDFDRGHRTQQLGHLAAAGSTPERGQFVRGRPAPPPCGWPCAGPPRSSPSPDPPSASDRLETVAGTPDSRCEARSSFEPHHGKTPTGGSALDSEPEGGRRLASKPAEAWRHYGDDPAAPEITQSGELLPSGTVERRLSNGALSSLPMGRRIDPTGTDAALPTGAVAHAPRPFLRRGLSLLACGRRTLRSTGAQARTAPRQIGLVPIGADAA